MFLALFGFGVVPFQFGTRFGTHVPYFRERVPCYRFVSIWYAFRLGLVQVVVYTPRFIGFKDVIPCTTFLYHVSNCSENMAAKALFSFQKK